jgi:SET domain
VNNEPYCNEAPDHFLNHSCDPNIWLADEVTLITKRAINVVEEITADYATWETEEDWVAAWSCNCSSHLCRGLITGRDWRLPELQDRYSDHFLLPLSFFHLSDVESHSVLGRDKQMERALKYFRQVETNYPSDSNSSYKEFDKHYERAK